MVYVKHFNILGIDTAQVPCIELQGVPNTATEGAVGLFGMNMTSADHEIYVCIAVNGNVYTWIPLKGEGGNTVTDAKVNDDGELVLTLSNGTSLNAGVVAGNGCFVNGVATDINFDSDPQEQLNNCVKQSELSGLYHHTVCVSELGSGLNVKNLNMWLNVYDNTSDAFTTERLVNTIAERERIMVFGQTQTSDNEYLILTYVEYYDDPLDPNVIYIKGHTVAGTTTGRWIEAPNLKVVSDKVTKIF